MLSFKEEQKLNLTKLKDLERIYNAAETKVKLRIWENKQEIIDNWAANGDWLDDDGQIIDWLAIGNETFDDFWDTEPVIELDLGNGIPHYYHTADYEEIYKLL